MAILSALLKILKEGGGPTHPAAPFIAFKAVTPSDTVDLPDGFCRALHLSADGAVKITDLYGNEVTLSLKAGVNLYVGAVRVWATGTAAVDITACY